jgi:hypothetical protein
MTTYYTKKDLEREFDIADTTVYRTLQACGLPTSRTKYTEQEITTRFKVARQLFAAKHTFVEVQQYFGLRPVHVENTQSFYALHEKAT